MRSLTPLVAAAALLIGGSASYVSEETVVGIALLTAGLICLGCWLGIEAWKSLETKQKEPDDHS